MHLLLINSYKIRLTGTYALNRVVQGINNGEWWMKHNEVQELVINLGKVSSNLHSSFHLSQIYLVGPVQHSWETHFVSTPAPPRTPRLSLAEFFPYQGLRFSIQKLLRVFATCKFTSTKSVLSFLYPYVSI